MILNLDSRDQTWRRQGFITSRRHGRYILNLEYQDRDTRFSGYSDQVSMFDLDSRCIWKYWDNPIFLTLRYPEVEILWLEPSIQEQPTCVLRLLLLLYDSNNPLQTNWNRLEVPVRWWPQPFLDRLQRKINPRCRQDRPPHLYQRVTLLVSFHVGGELLG